MSKILHVFVAGSCLIVGSLIQTHFTGNRHRVSEATSQAPLHVGGSFVVAVVCKDGILVAADSRGSIVDDQQRRLAYYDGVQKVFPLGNNAIAYTGVDFIQNIHFAALVREFSRVSPARVDQVLPAFLQFSDRLPEEARAKVRTQQLIAAGYIEGGAQICYYNEAQTAGPKYGCGLGLVTSDRTRLDDYGPKLLAMGRREAASLLEQEIKTYARQHGKDNIGGPTYIRFLTPQRSGWLGDEPRPRPWTYLHDLTADYRQGKLKLTLLPGVNRSELDAVMRRGDIWSRGRDRR